MRELFVYYRVRPDQVDAARRATLAFAARLRHELPHVRTRWLRRADPTGSDDAPDASPTWMEHHAVVDPDDRDGMTPALQAAIVALATGLLPFIDGPRHVEVFVPLPDAEPPTA